MKVKRKLRSASSHLVPRVATAACVRVPQQLDDSIAARVRARRIGVGQPESVSDAFSPGGTATAGYEPDFDDSIASRVRARRTALVVSDADEMICMV